MSQNILSNVCCLFLLLPLISVAQKTKTEHVEKQMDAKEYRDLNQNKTITEKEFQENYMIAGTHELLNQLDLGRLPITIPAPYRKMNIGALPVKQLLIERMALTDSINRVLRDTIFPLEQKMSYTHDLELKINTVDLQLLLYKRFTQCNQQIKNQQVEFYDGSRGVSKELVQERMGQIGQLIWNYKFRGFDPATDKEGTVKGVRWGSGCMIAKDLFLTAGHCLSNVQKGWTMPMKKGSYLLPEELSKLMQVQFNYEYDKAYPLNANGIGKIRSDTINYPVLELMEYRIDENGGLDYAILRLDKGADGMLPGEKFGIIPICDNNELNQGDKICVIQHPDGMEKVIGGGSALYVDESIIYYDDIDTSGGSSGAPVISSNSKKLVGIHFYGDCGGRLKSNQASRMDAIKKVSKYIK